MTTTWTRRTLLRQAGVSTLALAGLATSSALLAPRALAAAPTKFIYAWTAFDVMDPHVKYDAIAAFFNLNMYDNLVRYVGNPPEIVPWLAETYDVDAEGRVWTFHLRSGVTFHDGSPLTAEAVHFSFERLLALGKGPSAIFKRMGLKPDKIEVVDLHTVVIRLEQPFGPFLAALPILSIVNPAIIKAHEQDHDWAEKWLVRNEAGSGSYELVTFNPATGFTMKRYAPFWKGWNPHYVDEVEIRLIRETSSRVLALMKGDIHTADTNLPPDQLEKLEKHPRLKVIPEVSMAPFYVRMHNQREPFTDHNFRLALSHAFNYDSFIKDILKGRGIRNPGPLPRTLWGYPEDLVGYHFDLDKAKAYLAQAKVKITRPLDIHIQGEFEQTVQAALLFQSDVARLGIELRIVKSLFPTIVASTKTPESSPDMWMHWTSTHFVDPENWLGDMYDSHNWGTWKASSWYKNPQVDDLLQRARSIVAQAERAKLYEEASRLVVADAPDIFVYNRIEYVPLAKQVQGFKFSPVGSGRDFWHVYFAPTA